MDPILSSLTHPIVKYLIRLKEKKPFRQEHKRVVIFGKKIVQDLPKDLEIHTLLSVDPHLLPKVKAKKRYLVTEAIMKKIYGEGTSDGIAAEVSMPLQLSKMPLNSLLVLDRIQDPGNLGTLLRTALALGWQAVYLLEGSCDPFNDKALKASMGATFCLPLLHGNREGLLSVIDSEKLTPYAAALQGTPLDALLLSPKPLLILGNESKGITADLLSLSQPVSIPMRGKMESLNVSCAGAILMYQLLQTQRTL